MDTPPTNRLEEIFAHAVALPDGERAAWLDLACAGNAELRVEVEALLRSHKAAGFMKGLPAGPEIEAEFARLKPEEAGDRIGNYKLLEQIGEGGFGTVWVAEQEKPVRRRVALKILKLGMDTKEVIARFEQERQSLAMMDHPNIAKVHDAGATQYGRPYFVMELVRGIRITDYCDQANLSTADRLELFIAVCNAVQHAHQKGIIHRDLKPSNILVTVHDGTAMPKVIDFGVAKATQTQRLTDLTVYTQFEQMIGTPLYMSPEQAEMGGLDIDTRSDIYSLGVLLYELLTGRTPFDPEELMRQGLDEMRRAIREQEPQKPSTALQTMTLELQSTVAQHRQTDSARLVSLVRGDLDWIVMKALEKDRTRRYATAIEFARDIQRHLTDEPVHARPPTQLYRLRRLLRRNRLAFTAAAIVSAALVAGAGISVWHLLVARKATIEALLAKGRAESAMQQEAAERANAEAQEEIATSMAYAANMNLIQRAWDRGEIGVVEELLNRTRGHRQRGFEWYYWQKLCHQALLTIRDHASPISALAISPDGTRLAIGDYNGIVTINRLDSGLSISTLDEGSSISNPGFASVTALAFSPNGLQIGISRKKGRYGTTVIHDLAGNKLLRPPNEMQAGTIRNILFSPDGLRMATVADQDAYIWDTANGKWLIALKGDATKLWWVSLSKGQEQIIVPAVDGEFLQQSDRWTIRPPNPGTGTTRPLGEHRYQRSPDGQRIIAQGPRGPDVWTMETGLKERIGYNGPIDVFAFSSDGERIVTSVLNTATVFETSTGRSMFTLTGHWSQVCCIAFSAVGKRIVTGSVDGQVKIWDASGPDLETIFPSKSDPSISAFYPNGQRVLVTEVGSDSGGLNVWDVQSKQRLFSLKPEVVDPASRTRRESERSVRAAISPDGTLIATSTARLGLVIWDATTGKELRRIGASSPASWRHELVVPIMFTQDNCLLTGGAYSPRIANIVTIAPPSAKLWDVSLGQQLTSFPRFGEGISALAIANDSNRILTADTLGSIALWNRSDQNKLLQFDAHGVEVRAVEFFPRDDRFVTVSKDRTAKIWSSAGGTPLKVLKGHRDEINAVAIDSSGTRIVTGSSDRTVKFWDALTGSELLTLDAGVSVKSVALTKDGRRLLSTARGYPDPRLRGELTSGTKIWDVASEEQVATWQNEEALVIRSKPEEVVRDQSIPKLSDWFRNPALCIWKGVAYDHRAWASGELARAKTPSADPISIDEAVKLYCLLPSSDPKLMADALASIRGAVPANKDNTDLPWYQMTLGMAEYRSGNYAAADDVLTAVEKLTANNDAYQQAFCTAKMFHSMSLFRQEKEADAKAFFSAGEARMKPIPAGKPDLAARLADHDDLIAWIAHKEAKALLGRGGSKNANWDSFELLRDAALLARDGRDLDHLHTCRRILAFADSLEYPDDVERAARMHSLRPSSDQALSAAALSLARKAVSMAGSLSNVPWYRMTLGMAEYRNGNYEAADAALMAAARTSGTSSVRHVARTSGLFHSMSLFQQGKASDAVLALIKSEIGMKAFTSNEDSGGKEEVDDLILGLARKEARFLLQPIFGPAQRYQAYSTLIDSTELSQADRSALLLERSYALREMDRIEEAAADNLRALEIAPRAGDSDEHTIDLSLYFNASLTKNWHGDSSDNNLSGLLAGMHILAATKFDCRGLVQLRGVNQSLNRFPIQVSQIKIGRHCGHVHFLHACLYGNDVPIGTEVGKYRFHFGNQQIREYPVIVGRDVLDWWAKAGGNAATNDAVVAWIGTNGKSKRQNEEVRLFKSSWKNPMPEEEIKTVEFVSAMTKAAPFLVAITVEP